MLSLRESTVAVIDKWRYQNEVPSRSEAVERLIELALKQNGQGQSK